MKRLIAVCGVLVMCVAGSSCSSDSTSTSPPASSETTRIAGTVVDAQTGMPLPGATATSGAFFMTTAADGRFSLHGLSPDAHVRIAKPGYTPIERIATDEFGTVQMHALSTSSLP
jgi:hypothetical protein